MNPPNREVRKCGVASPPPFSHFLQHHKKEEHPRSNPLKEYLKGRKEYMTTRLTQLSSQLTSPRNNQSKMAESDIHLYTTQTPNGIKISITLEELGLPYKVTKIDISKNTQKEPWFLEINPNGRIPALTDTFTDGKLIRVFESGSIQQYLVERYDKDYKISYPRGTREFYEMNNWVLSFPPTFEFRRRLLMME